MGMYRCMRCDELFDSKDGDCILVLDADGDQTFDMVNEACASAKELFANSPDDYDDPDAPCDCGEWKCDECRARTEGEPAVEVPER